MNNVGGGAIVDPSASGAIPASSGGVVDIITAGAETRTIAAPTSVGALLVLNADTIVTSCTVAFVTAFDAASHAHLELTAAGQNATFASALINGVKTWRLVSNEGATLQA